MKINPTRWLTFLTLVLALGVSTLSLAERGNNSEDGFGPPEGHDGPPMLDEEKNDGRDRDRNRRNSSRLSDEDLAAAHAIVARLYPELTERLDGLRDEDSRKYKQTLERRFPRVKFLVELEKRDPAMFELRMADISLDRQTDALAKQLREARKADDKDGYEDLRDEIEVKVTEHFEVRQQIREAEIEMLKLKLEQLEERLDDHDDDRKDLIEQRVDELAGPDW